MIVNSCMTCEIFPEDYALQNDFAIRQAFLKHILVLPLGLCFGDSCGEDVVPSVKKNPECEERRILVRPWIAEH